ncbi:MAG: NAD-dependent epimerase [Fibrobacterota bacterium]
MKILVTGAAGFIGFHLSKKLLSEGIEIIGFDNVNDYYDPALKEARLDILQKEKNFSFRRADLTDLKSLEALFRENKINKICHLAAQAGVRYSIENPHAYVESNLVGFQNIIEMARHFEVDNFVYASSSSVYGNNKKVPFSVSDNVDQPISLYAATKKSNELTAHVYHHLYGINCTGLRFFTVYGPWGRPDMALYIFTKKIAAGEPIDVYNYGKMKRDFTYVDDIVAGIKASLEKNHPYEVFNLGNNNTVELLYFIECVEKNLGKKAEKNMLPIQPGDVPETFADIDRSKELLGYEPHTKIEEGIENFISWYRQYHG